MTDRTIDKKIMTYGSVTLILSLIAIALRTVCLFTSFDVYIGYYKEGFLSTMLGAFLFLSAVYCISALFTVKDDTVCATGRENGIGIRVISAICAFVLIYTGVNGILSSLESHADNKAFLTVLSVVAVLAAVFFLMKVSYSSNYALQGAIALIVVIYCVAVVIITYFDFYELLNGPNKVTMHMALISSAVFFLAEIRAYVSDIKKGYYVAFLTLATFFCGVSSVPMLIFVIASDYSERYIDYHVVTFALFLYFASRLVSFVISSGRMSDGEKIEDDVIESQEDIA